MSHTILITGGTGQVGNALSRLCWPGDVILHTPTRAELDLTAADDIAAAFAANDYAAVINPAAYTAVDKAESDAAGAFRANAVGPAILADAARAAGIPLIHVSTDYVFDGSESGFYAEDARVAPLGVYGSSKLAGEYAALSGTPRATILRTAWVISAHGSNFLKTMLRVGAMRDRLGVVHDQVGCPTSADDIARALQTIALRQINDETAPTGVYHFVNAGEASWCDLAREIFDRAAGLGGPTPTVDAIATADYPTPARRPANSRLSTARITADYDIRPRPWREAVADIVAETYANQGAAQS